jgi:iron(III) transport system permease protein
MSGVLSVQKKLRSLPGKLTSPVNLLGIILALIVITLVLAPLVSLLYQTFTVSLIDSFRLPGAEPGDLTLYHWKRVIATRAAFLSPLFNSLFVALGTATLAMIIGAGLAWLVVQTDIPLRGSLSLLAVVPYVLPSWALALPWVEFFKNSSVGRPPGFLQYYTGVEAPAWIVFGPVPIIVVMALHYYPFVYLMVSSALVNIDSQTEEASELLGASRWHTLRRITFPAVVPSLVAASLLAFARTIGTYGTPALLGGPVGFTVLSVQIRSFLQMNVAPRAFILALELIVISVVLLYLNQRLVGTRKSFSLIGGKGFKRRRIELRKLRLWMSLGAHLFLIVFVIAPLFLLVWSSFMRSAGSYSLENFTLHYWIGRPDPNFAQAQPGLLRNPRVLRGTLNSLRISLLGGAICSLIGMLLGYVIVKRRGSALSRFLENISFLPMLVPSIAFGAIYLSFFSRPIGPIPALYGTAALMILLVVGKQMPFTTRTGIGSMFQVAGELEEAAEITGASWPRRFAQIIWPLARSGFISGMLIAFITTMRELSLFILVITSKTEVLTTLTFDYADIGLQQLSNAMMSFLIVVIFAVVGLVRLYEKLTEKQKRA